MVISSSYKQACIEVRDSKSHEIMLIFIIVGYYLIILKRTCINGDLEKNAENVERCYARGGTGINGLFC